MDTSRVSELTGRWPRRRTGILWIRLLKARRPARPCGWRDEDGKGEIRSAAARTGGPDCATRGRSLQIVRGCAVYFESLMNGKIYPNGWMLLATVGVEGATIVIACFYCWKRKDHDVLSTAYIYEEPWDPVKEGKLHVGLQEAGHRGGNDDDDDCTLCVMCRTPLPRAARRRPGPRRRRRPSAPAGRALGPAKPRAGPARRSAAGATAPASGDGGGSSSGVCGGDRGAFRMPMADSARASSRPRPWTRAPSLSSAAHFRSCASDRRWGTARRRRLRRGRRPRATSRTSPSRATSPMRALGASGAPLTGCSRCRPSAFDWHRPTPRPRRPRRTAWAVLRFGSRTLSVPLRSLLRRKTVNLLLVFGLGGDVVAVGAAAVAAMPVRGRPRGDSDDCPGCLRTVTAANRLPLVFFCPAKMATKRVLLPADGLF